MFSKNHYVPILKTKAGELAGLEKTEQSVMKNLTPFLEIVPIPPKWVENEDDPIPSKSIEAHVKSQVEAIVKSIGDNSFFVDGIFVEEEDTFETGEEPIGAILNGLIEAGLSPIPATGLDRIAEYDEAVKGFIADNKCGFALRITTFDLQEIDQLENQIDSILDFMGCDAENVDLLVDFGIIQPESLGILKASVPSSLAVLPYITKWRSLIIAGSGFPADLAHMSQHSTDESQRTEWELWLHLRKKQDKLKGKRLPTFGDYATTNPDLVEIDPRKMRMAPKIKYTDQFCWLVAKGEAYRRKKDSKKSMPASEQYPRLAKKIMTEVAWKGASFSWGDSYISECASGNCVGGPKEWVAVATCHHLAFVVQQLASLP